MVLTDSEMEYIRKEIGREPNALEEGMLDVMFSEHCSYKSSRPILGLFPNEGENIIMGPGDDAGIVSITDDLAIAIGIESHNHPSAIEPYGGAGTGIGGILRDIISMGAMPIALLDSLRFGNLKDQKSRYLFEHVVKGISDYGNRVGVPTVGGEVEFDDSYVANPLVNVMCVGLVNKNDIVKGIAPNVGDVFLLMGGRTGRDGIHGVTFASEELTSNSEIEDKPAVQVADPFTKKRVLEASLEILEKLPVSGVKDLGGGGLTCCVSELVDSCNNGAWVDLNAISLREEGMTPYEIMLSESQERMIFVINPNEIKEAIAICEKHELPVSVIGTVTNGNRMVIEDKDISAKKGQGEIIADLPTIILADPPNLNREIKEPVKEKVNIDINHPIARNSMLSMISSSNIATKEWVYKQYDHEVQIRTVVKPGDDAAVLKIDNETGIALTVDCNTIHTKLSPYDGGAGSVAEAIRNVVSMGAKPYAVVDCLNFGNPENPEVLWQFRECVKGMADLATKFKTPVISGNVSFYNETEGIIINPSPTVGVIGVLSLDNIKTMSFKDSGDKIIIIGDTFDELEGSEYHRTIHNIEEGNAPKIRIDDEIKSAETVLNIIDKFKDNITGIHDCSAGGIAIALGEMALSGEIGAKIDLSAIPSQILCSDVETKNELLSKILFSESHGRYIITVKSDIIDKVLDECGVIASCIGEVNGDYLEFASLNGCGGGMEKFKISVSELKDAYTGTIEEYMV